MPESEKITKNQRADLLDALSKRFESSTGFRNQCLYLRKKYFWIFVVGGTKALKSFIDIFVALTAGILLLPFIILISLLIKLQDGGPVLYISKRVGKWGREFDFYKFRTMYVNADKMKEQLLSEGEFKGDVIFKMKKDPRITKIGAILRKTSLDELPQLWNVIKGDMSLVGPRPHLPSEVAKYNIEDRRRLDIQPGITCIWQVSGRSDLPFEKQLKLDLQYIESHNFWFDIKLLFKTIPAVLFGKGAY